MFEHLDDRDGFRPSTSLLATVTRAGRRRRRRTRVVQAGTASVAALAIGAGVTVTSFNRKLDSIERVEVAGLVDAPADSTEPYTVLLTGLDRALDLEDGAPNQRTDTIALVRVDPASDTLRYLSVPRDLWVDVPGHGEARINSAMVLGAGGPGLLIETLADLGIEVNHYVGLDFDGAKALGDAVGGLRLSFEHPTRDRRSGLAVAAGCQTLDGSQALALARARHLEVETSPGVWVSDRTSDYGRMARQHQVAMAGLATFSRLDPTDPGELSRFVDAVVDHVTLDPLTSRDRMIEIFRDVAGARIEELWLPVEEHTTGGAAVLVPADDGRFEEVLEQFRSGGTTTGTTGDEPTSLPETAERAIVPRPC